MRWIMVAIVLAFLLSTFLMYDSDGGGGAQPEPTADGRLEDYAVASINGQNLMRSDLEAMVSGYIQQFNINARNMTSRDVPYLRQAALDNAAVQTELNKEIEARDIEVGEEEITAQINVMADNFPTRETFYQSLERSGVRMEDLRTEVSRRIAEDKTVALVVKPDPVSADAVREFYDNLGAYFYNNPKGYAFDYVSLSVDKTAADIRERIAADSSKWNEIISSDPRPGDIIRRSTEPLFFAEATLSADPKLSHLVSIPVGGVGNVVEVRSNDFMIAIKRESREAYVTPFERVSADIRTRLESENQRIAMERFRSDLMARAVVEIYDPSIFPAPRSADIETLLNNMLSLDMAAASGDAAAVSASVSVPATTAAAATVPGVLPESAAVEQAVPEIPAASGENR